MIKLVQTLIRWKYVLVTFRNYPKDLNRRATVVGTR